MQSVDVRITAGETTLAGMLVLPARASGLVAFVHGSGSSRFSTRNQYVADVMNEAGLATLLFDLLTPAEELADQTSREYRFNIHLLSLRTIATIDWLATQAATAGLAIGLFGASTGAAAALNAAAHRTKRISAVVSRGGRPDLATESLPLVKAPTLLIVGADDGQVIDLNQQAAAELTAPNETLVIPGASHLFEEPGKLAEVAAKSRDWFLRWFADNEF